MRHGVAVVFFLLALVASGAALGQCTDPKTLKVPDGFPVSTAQMLSLSDDSLAAYLVGFVNGTLFSVVAGSETECIAQLTLCIADKSAADLVLALRRYVADRPEMLQGTSMQVTFNSVFGACFSEFHDVPSTGT